MTAPSSRASDAAARRRSGFTLLELMVSLGIGGLAITSIYAISAASTVTFQQQQQVATSQTALRMAMNQVKRDIARAGYLATPSASAPGQSCGPIGAPIDDNAVGGSGRLAAFSRFQNNVITTGAGNPTGIDPTGHNRANGFTADDIVLMANYETSAEYPGVTLIDATDISVDQHWHSFRRDFTDWFNNATPAYNGVAFKEAFRVGRLIRIQTTKRQRHFATITALTEPNDVLPSVHTPVVITFAPAIPNPCLSDVTNGWVSPVSAIHYFARNASGADAERFNTIDPIAQLIREEVLPSDKVAPLLAPDGTPNSRAVLDYLVEFNLYFLSTTGPGPGPPGGTAVLDVATAAADNNNNNNQAGTSETAVNTNPERIRSVTIDLAVRSPQADPKLPWTQAGCGPPGPILKCFEVALPDVQPGAARVRRMRAEVFVPNVGYEDL
jgi:prepilin-type N-terminal cleavage/methylation domain-containing protein